MTETNNDGVRTTRGALFRAARRCTRKQVVWLRALGKNNFQRWSTVEKLGFSKSMVRQWLRDERVRAVLDIMDQIAADDVEITTHFILQGYKRLASYDMRKLYDADGNLKKPSDWDDDSAFAVVERSFNEKGLPKVRMADRKAALDALANFKKLIVQRHEVSGPGGKPLQAPTIAITFPDGGPGTASEPDDDGVETS